MINYIIIPKIIIGIDLRGGFDVAITDVRNDAEEKIGKRNSISKAPIRRLMKNEGGLLVSDDAVSLLVSKLTEIASNVTKEAVKVMKDDGRKRLTKEDIEKVEK